jgi:ketol-acid reductoisomerase
VGLRKESPSWKMAEAVGFTEKDGTLGEMFQTIRESDLVILLISDAAQAKLYKVRARVCVWLATCACL